MNTYFYQRAFENCLKWTKISALVIWTIFFLFYNHGLSNRVSSGPIFPNRLQIFSSFSWQRIGLQHTPQPLSEGGILKLHHICHFTYLVLNCSMESLTKSQHQSSFCCCKSMAMNAESLNSDIITRAFHTMSASALIKSGCSGGFSGIPTQSDSTAEHTCTWWWGWALWECPAVMSVVMLAIFFMWLQKGHFK